jgi:hypothetical protein
MLGLTELGDIGSAVILVIALPLVFMAGLGGFIGYYFDAKAIRSAGGEWVPTWWLYMLGHSLLSPAFVAPIYLVQRHRHVGRP